MKGWQVRYIMPGNDEVIEAWFDVTHRRQFQNFLEWDREFRPELDPVVTWVGF